MDGYDPGQFGGRVHRNAAEEHEHEQDENVRRNDLDEAAPAEGREIVERPAFEQVARIRIKQREAADEKEKLDPDEADSRHLFKIIVVPEGRDVRNPLAYEVRVVPHDHEDGDAPQTIEPLNAMLETMRHTLGIERVPVLKERCAAQFEVARPLTAAAEAFVKGVGAGVAVQHPQDHPAKAALP